MEGDGQSRRRAVHHLKPQFVPSPVTLDQADFKDPRMEADLELKRPENSTFGK